MESKRSETNQEGQVNYFAVFRDNRRSEFPEHENKMELRKLYLKRQLYINISKNIKKEKRIIGNKRVIK